MKKLLLLIIMISSFTMMSHTAKAQLSDAYVKGREDGTALAEYIIGAYIAPNLPPQSDFISVVQSNNVISVNGIYYYTFSTIVGGIDYWAYANAVTNYAYDNGIFAFYRDYMTDVLTEAGMPDEYIFAYRNGYNTRMKGRIVEP